MSLILFNLLITNCFRTLADNSIVTDMQLHEADVVVLFKNGCPHSIAALKTLDMLKQDYKAFEESSYPDLKNYVHDTLGYKTFPAVFVGGHFIGGNAELQKAIANKSFFEMLPKNRRAAPFRTHG